MLPSKLLSRSLVVVFCAALSACVGPPGEKGESCTVSDNGDGTATIRCADGTSVTVTQGREGGSGPAGDAGTSCTIQSRTDGGRALVCSDGTMTDLPTGNACTVSNIDGGRLITCTDGTTIPVLNGSNGTNGTNGSTNFRDAFRVDQFHGTNVLEAEELAATGRYLANMTITSADVTTAGVVTVNFRISDQANQAVRGVRAVQANIAKLLPGASTQAPDGGPVYSRWVPYIWRLQTVTAVDGGTWPAAAGTRAWQPNREGNGNLVDNGDGTYVYTFATNISNIALDGGPATTFERSRLHRIAVMTGGSSGPTADAWFDFVPDGTPAGETRRLIDTNNCRTCHGEEFRAHGGDRLTVEVCVTCHVPNAIDPHGGQSIDMAPMIHKIHAGAELQSIPGPDGIVFDNPATTVNEQADNGTYAIWGFGNTKHEWWNAGFPAVIENCTKCHNDKPSPGTLPQLTNWKTKPSRDACGSCHDLVNFATGANHPIPMMDDNSCATCHPASGAPSNIVKPIEHSHDWTDDDARNVPEFNVEMTVNTPTRGYFMAGEAPVVTMVIRDAATGQAIDHTTFLQDIDGAEGCLAAGCPPGDGKFAASAFFVHGPRGNRNPVLTLAARAEVLARDNGPWNLGAADAGASLSFVVDNGQDLRRPLDLLTTTLRGTITVTPPATGFADRAAANPAEVAAWLNNTAAFRARAIAYIDEQTGRLAVRSRNLGKVFAIQVTSTPLGVTIFNDFTVKSMTGYYPSNTIAKAWLADGGTPAATAQDPKVTYAAANVQYQLDPVDDLAPGTYIASVEFRDRGGVNTANYKTPSVAKVQFQVKQLAEELPPARNCDTCHGSPENGKGMVFDFYRHYKILSDDKAVDQCGACHDNQNASVTGAWAGGAATSRRVHAVHAGSELNYPLITVGYSNGDPVPGRNWDIKFTQNLRNCQVCHPDTTSSGSWKSKPARLPCGGCHDSDAATAHMTIMTSDPTPANPFSGDEAESCQTCH